MRNDPDEEWLIGESVRSEVDGDMGARYSSVWPAYLMSPLGNSLVSATSLMDLMEIFGSLDVFLENSLVAMISLPTPLAVFMDIMIIYKWGMGGGAGY